jgi:hypothetical protein
MAITNTQQLDQINAQRLYQAPEVKIVNGLPVKFFTVPVHEFRLGDVEDPDLYAAEPLMAWQKSPGGTWVMDHAAEIPYWVRVTDYANYGVTYRIMARLSEPDLVFFKLKFS